MTDYVGVVLQGLFTGIGVILAQKVWQVYEKQKELTAHVLNKIVGYDALPVSKQKKIKNEVKEMCFTRATPLDFERIADEVMDEEDTPTDIKRDGRRE